MSAGAGRAAVDDYQARLSGPLLDRIDIRIEVPAVVGGRPDPAGAERSRALRWRRGSRAAQGDPARTLCRARGSSGVTTNAQCAAVADREVAAPDAAARGAAPRAPPRRCGFSARGYHRVLKVARTLADLDGAETVGRIHLAEALSYRVVGDRLVAAA